MLNFKSLMLITAITASSALHAENFSNGGLQFQVVQQHSAQASQSNTEASSLFQGQAVREHMSRKAGLVTGQVLLVHDGSLSQADIPFATAESINRISNTHWLVKYGAVIDLLSVRQQLRAISGVQRVIIDIAFQTNVLQ